MKDRFLRNRKRYAVFLFMLLSLFLATAAREAKAASTCKVYFRENTGGKGEGNVMSTLTLTVDRGTKVALPALPVAEGYTALGWTRVKGASAIEYQPGARVKVNKSTVFYAVRQELEMVTIQFMNNKGTKSYGTLGMTARKGSYIVLPQVPEASGYLNLGWSTKKGKSAPLYTEGTRRKASKDIIYYAVRRKAEADVTVRFLPNGGGSDPAYTVLQATISGGTPVLLPEVEDPSGYTFLGWDTEPGKTMNPTYLAGTKITPTENMNLYAVMYPWVEEENVTTLATGWQLLYRKVVFVGDSRMNRMSMNLKATYGLSPNLVEVEFVCAEGQGLSWFQSSGKQQLLSVLGYGVRPAAVILNFGINDLWNSEKYVAYFKEIESELKAKNVKLFFMSVNPVNRVMLEKSGRTTTAALYRTPQRVIAFNEMMRTQLCADTSYTYMDMYSFLIANGFRYDSGNKNGVDSGMDDGLHYCGRTYRRIYNQVIAFLLGNR